MVDFDIDLTTVFFWSLIGIAGLVNCGFVVFIFMYYLHLSLVSTLIIGIPIAIMVGAALLIFERAALGH